MIQFTKKLSVFMFVIAVSLLGMMVGQNLTRQVIRATAYAAPAQSDKQERYQNLELFQKVLHFVENNYVEEVKNKDIMYGAIKGMLETLDPHSTFLTAEVFRDMKIDTSGKFGGIGIEIGMKDNILTIIAPIEDTPAWKAGLKPGDRIVKINSESTKGMNLVEAVSKMRGKKGTDVTLSIYRDGFEKIREVAITRDIIKIQAVKFEELESGYGYIRIATFNENTSNDLKKALGKLESKQKLKGLVLDMRTNPGGLLDQAVEVASQFIDNGVVVSTIGRNKDQKDVKYARKGSARKDFPMAILVNSSTASAAEIVAGALQDHKRALVLGVQTFGKGSVQTVIDLGNETGLKLTIARYYSPSGRSIQEKGIVPDVILDDYDPKLLTEAKRKQDFLREKDLKSHLLNDEEKSAEDKLKEKEAKEFKDEELRMSLKKKKKKDKDADKDEEEELVPIKFNPKEDYQTKEALNYLKSYDAFRKLKVE